VAQVPEGRRQHQRGLREHTLAIQLPVTGVFPPVVRPLALQAMLDLLEIE
jgi:hypothetical protein